MAFADTINLNEVLRTPDDLKKIPTLKAEIIRRKALVDEQVRQKRDEMHTITQNGMSSLGNAQQITNMIREEMMNIERLGAEAQAVIVNFPKIRDVATLHRNFQAVEKMKSDLESFQERLDDVISLIRQDEQTWTEEGDQENLLRVHYELSQLREIRDEALEQAKKAPDRSILATLDDNFKGLDEAVEDFNVNLGNIMASLITCLFENNEGIVVRMAVIIANEEKRDEQIRERRLVREEHSDLAVKFKSLAVGERELREYKQALLSSIESVAAAKLQATDQEFIADPDNLEKHLRWFFNDLNAAKKGLPNLMPKDWKIFQVYVQIYHRLICDWLQSKVLDEQLNPTHMLAVIHYKQKYLDKFRRLQVLENDLVPPLPGGRDSDLAREYQKLIVDKVDQWMSEINSTDLQALQNRRTDTIEPDEHGCFRTKSSNDLWIMLSEQLTFASSSDIPEITEGVVISILSALHVRREAFARAISGIDAALNKADFSRENTESLFDWLVALANDALAYTGAESDGGRGRIEHFQDDCKTLLSADVIASLAPRFNTLTDNYLDLITLFCIRVFVRLIFILDLKPAIAEIFTSTWSSQGGQQVPAILEALVSYLEDYLPRASPLVGNLIIEEMSKSLLVAYLSAVGNKSAKFRRNDTSFLERVRADVGEVFKTFSAYPPFEEIRASWRAVQVLTSLLECGTSEIASVFEENLREYPDLKVTWVEAVLRVREDVEFGAISGEGKGIVKNLRQIAAERRPDVAVGGSIFAWVQ